MSLSRTYTSNGTSTTSIVYGGTWDGYKCYACGRWVAYGGMGHTCSWTSIVADPTLWVCFTRKDRLIEGVFNTEIEALRYACDLSSVLVVAVRPGGNFGERFHAAADAKYGEQ